MSRKPKQPSGRRGPAWIEPAWIDERNLERGNMRVAQGFSKLRADAAFSEAETCPDCAAARAAEGDEEALCEHHLAHAMGMLSAW